MLACFSLRGEMIRVALKEVPIRVFLWTSLVARMVWGRLMCWEGRGDRCPLFLAGMLRSHQLDWLMEIVSGLTHSAQALQPPQVKAL